MRHLEKKLFPNSKAATSCFASALVTGASLLTLSAFSPAHAFNLNSSAKAPQSSASYTLNNCLSGPVSGDVGCQYLTPNNNSLQATESLVNDVDPTKTGFQYDGFFGNSNWHQLFKEEDGADVGQSGSFVLDVQNTWNSAMVVFKDGNDTNLIGFLLGGLEYGNNTISWTTPFTDPPFDFNNNQAKNVSNYVVFYSETALPGYPGSQPVAPPQPVPEPTTILGLAIAGGIGAILKRKYVQQNQKTVV